MHVTKRRGCTWWEDIKLKRLIKKNNNKNRDSISKVIADGSYDSNENLLSISLIPIK